MVQKLFLSILFIATAAIFSGCEAKNAIEDAIDVADVDRKPIDRSMTGLNAFANDSRFGSISSQYSEVKNTLGIRYVRILMNWDDGVQSSPAGSLNFSFYDQLVSGVPAGVEVLIVTTSIPSWMRDSSNWIGGNPRRTFVQKWLRPLAQHYAGNGKVAAIQIWNEPNMVANSNNGVMGFDTDASLYTEMLSLGSNAIKAVAPRIKVLNAATTAINQNAPSTIDYNEVMVQSGALDAVDVYAIHYYGKQFERVVGNNGVADFLNGSVNKPIWVTESGAQGVNNQLPYVEQAWPFLKEKIPGIQRFYYYQFTEATGPETTYGLRNLSQDFPVSDLYIWLRDR